MKKTHILATIVAGSALAFAGFGCSHNDKDTTAPNQYSAPATPGTVNPDMNQGGMEPGVGSGVNQRQNVNGTDQNGVSAPTDNPGGPVQKNNNTPANPDMNQGTPPPTPAK
jgi:hypothetical protein